MTRIVIDIHDLVAASEVVDVDRSGGGRGRKSDLTRFLENEDAVAAIAAMTLNGHSWSAVAAFLSTQGIKDGVGQPPSGGRVRRAYWLARRSASAPAPLAKEISTVTTGARVDASPPGAGHPIDTERRPSRERIVFQHATVLIDPDVNLLPATPAEIPKSAVVDEATAQAKIAEVISNIKQRSLSLPKVVDTQ